MIKTAAFAPPRAASVPASRKPASRAASGSSNPAQPSLPLPPRSGPRVSTVAVQDVLPTPTKAKRARTTAPAVEAPQPAPSKAQIPKPASVAPSKKSSLRTAVVEMEERPEIIVTLTLPIVMEPEPGTGPVAKKAHKSVRAVEEPAPVEVASSAPAKARREAKAPVQGKQPMAKTKPPVAKTVEAAPELEAPKKRGRKSKIPDNLAEQYGQNLSKRAAVAPTVLVEEETPKKRRSREEREKRRQLMQPDPGLLQRLARVHDMVGSAPAKRTPRPRGWELNCGRCGTKTRFTTPGALCPKCGAMAVKD